MPISARLPERPERDMFVLYLRTGRRGPPLALKYNHNHDPYDGRFTFADAGGAQLTPEAKQVADKIGRDFFLRTGKRVHVTSGTRDPEKQAKAMLGKRSDWGIYKDQRAIAEIRATLKRSEAAGGSTNAKVAAMAAVIRRQTARGVYVSDHLKSRALDFSVGDLSARERAILVEVSGTHARKVLDEHVPQHVHVQY